MKTQNRIKEKFLRDNLIKIISEYQLYYQIALATYIKETTKSESFELAKKIEDLKLDIELEDVINTVVKVITTFNDEDDFEEVFKDNIKINAFIHALKNYIEKSKDLKDEDKVYKEYHYKIIEDQFYNVEMNIHFDDEMEERIEHWESFIDDETADKLREFALEGTKE